MIIKFFMGDSYNVMSCNHYHVTNLDCGISEVTLYPSYKSTDGVTYRVAGFDSRCETPHFDSCTVMNDYGQVHEEIFGGNEEILSNGVNKNE